MWQVPWSIPCDSFGLLSPHFLNQNCKEYHHYWTYILDSWMWLQSNWFCHFQRPGYKMGKINTRNNFSNSSKYQSMLWQEYFIGCLWWWELSITWYSTQCVADALYGAIPTTCSAWTPVSWTFINMKILKPWTNAVNSGWIKNKKIENMISMLL